MGFSGKVAHVDFCPKTKYRKQYIEFVFVQVKNGITGFSWKNKTYFCSLLFNRSVILKRAMIVKFFQGKFNNNWQRYSYDIYQNTYLKYYGTVEAIKNIIKSCGNWWHGLLLNQKTRCYPANVYYAKYQNYYNIALQSIIFRFSRAIKIG